MIRLPAFVLVGAAAVAPVRQAAPPVQIQNGRVETRQVAALDREVATLAAGATDPVWAGWRVPIVAGERGPCSTWDWDEGQYLRGVTLDYAPLGAATATPRPQFASPTGPVPIEAGTGLVVLLRLGEGRVERLRTLGDDCPIDAGGRTVYWLDGASPADSLRLLERLLGTDALERLSTNARNNLATSALSAIALHRDPVADSILDRLLTTAGEPDRREQAMTLVGRLRGAHGFTVLRKLLDGERASDMRVHLVNALGQTREPGTVDALRPLLRDADSRIRAAAVYHFAIRGGPAVLAEVTRVINEDTTESVRTRAIAGVARLPADTAAPALIQLARTSTNAAVRKQAVSALSRSRDPRAIAYLEEILKR
jgi:hypothetical protein